MQDTPPLEYAAIDLGSNSFHLLVAREVQGELQTVGRLGERVQLAAGLDAHHQLDAAAQERGLDCLKRFAQRLAGIPRDRIRMVGTNTLRAASNRWAFIDRAEALLECPLEVISGREEARLIYLGVAHSFADDQERRLVVDIGGGSTEFIIGQRFSPQALESLHMGCVSYTQRFFSDKRLTPKRFQKAINAAHGELLNIRRPYRRLGWDDVVGASGTIKALHRLATQQGSTAITRATLEDVREALLSGGTVPGFEQIKPERIQVLPAGLAILIATFEALELKTMSFSSGALREGVLFDLLGRRQHEDVRERTLGALMERYHVDGEQAGAVQATALRCLEQTRYDTPRNRDLLSWAARLHEVGLAISPSGFQKHGAYLLQHSDMMGFNLSEQHRLALLVRFHRRKLDLEGFPSDRSAKGLKTLCLLLRLAVLLHHSRLAEPLPPLDLQLPSPDRLDLRFPAGWLEQHPLSQDDLEQEQRYLAACGITLTVD